VHLVDVLECRAGAGEDKGTQTADWLSSVNKRSTVIARYGRCRVVLNVRTRVRDRTGRAVRESAQLRSIVCTLLQEQDPVGLVCNSRLGTASRERVRTDRFAAVIG
jgi:hypothetical protein